LLPYSWLAAFRAAGLTTGEQLVAICAGTQIYEVEGRWLGLWPTESLTQLSGRHRQQVWSAKAKLVAHGLVELDRRGKRYAGEPDVFDFSRLVAFKEQT
jgi:hypothetical protein